MAYARKISLPVQFSNATKVIGYRPSLKVASNPQDTLHPAVADSRNRNS